MAIFPLDEETKRRLMLTRGVNGELPDIPAPRPSPLPIPASPSPTPPLRMPEAPPRGLLSGGSAPIPMPNVGPASPNMPLPELSPSRAEFNPGISRSVELGGAREAAMAKPLSRGKGALLGAGLGVLRGLATGQGLGAAAGGALAGGIAGGISPKNVRAQQFDMFNKPKILERFAMEDADRQAQRQTQQDALEAEYKQAQIGALNRSNIPEPQREPALLNTPGGVLDPKTRTIIPGTQPLPRPAEPDYGSSPQGIFNRRTGKVTTPAQEKTPRAPSQALDALNELNQLRQQAEESWRRWSQPNPEDLIEGKDAVADTPERKELRRRDADAAMQAYNQAVANFGAIYGDWFETGSGQGGWSYVKPRQGQSQQRGGASQPLPQGNRAANPKFVEFIMSKKGFKTPEEAQRWIEAEESRR